MFYVTPFWGSPGKLANRNSMGKKHDIRWATKLDLEENEKERQKKSKEEGSDRYSLIFPHEISLVEKRKRFQRPFLPPCSRNALNSKNTSTGRYRGSASLYKNRLNSRMTKNIRDPNILNNRELKSNGFGSYSDVNPKKRFGSDKST